LLSSPLEPEESEEPEELYELPLLWERDGSKGPDQLPARAEEAIAAKVRRVV